MKNINWYFIISIKKLNLMMIFQNGFVWGTPKKKAALVALNLKIKMNFKAFKGSNFYNLYTNMIY